MTQSRMDANCPQASATSVAQCTQQIMARAKATFARHRDLKECGVYISAGTRSPIDVTVQARPVTDREVMELGQDVSIVRIKRWVLKSHGSAAIETELTGAIEGVLERERNREHGREPRPIATVQPKKSRSGIQGVHPHVNGPQRVGLVPGTKRVVTEVAAPSL